MTDQSEVFRWGNVAEVCFQLLKQFICAWGRNCNSNSNSLCWTLIDYTGRCLYIWITFNAVNVFNAVIAVNVVNAVSVFDAVNAVNSHKQKPTLVGVYLWILLELVANSWALTANPDIQCRSLLACLHINNSCMCIFWQNDTIVVGTHCLYWVVLLQ